MAQTANYGLQKPGTDKNVDEEFYQLQETLDLLDAILAALQTEVNGKAAASHTHTISQIVGLAAELAAKMPASQTFKLDDLTDVSGADGAPNNYVLVKSALGWLPSSALAALGTHGHLISEITGLVDALAGKMDVGALTADATGRAKMADGFVTSAKIADGAVTGSKLTATADDTFDDADKILYRTGTGLKEGLFSGFITSLFNGTRAIADGVFLAASYAWQNAGGFRRSHDISGHTANRTTTWPDGNVTIPAGTLITGANVATNVAASAGGSVGSYMLGAPQNGVAHALGDTIAGSSLRSANSGSATGGTQSGTWRCMGVSATSAVSTLWLRIS